MPLNLKNGNLIIEYNSTINFLGVIFDKHISWRDQIRAVVPKIANNIGLLLWARQVLTEMSLKTIYFFFIHSYLSYANIAWASTNVT